RLPHELLRVSLSEEGLRPSELHEDPSGPGARRLPLVCRLVRGRGQPEVHFGAHELPVLRETELGLGGGPSSLRGGGAVSLRRAGAACRPRIVDSLPDPEDELPGVVGSSYLRVVVEIEVHVTRLPARRSLGGEIYAARLPPLTPAVDPPRPGVELRGGVAALVDLLPAMETDINERGR